MSLDDYFEQQIAKKIFKSKIECRPVNAGFYLAFKHRISLAAYLTANFGCSQFRIMPEILFKLLRAAIWSSCDVRLESEQIPISRTGRRFISAGLHRIQLGKYLFVRMPRGPWMIERLSEKVSAALVGDNFMHGKKFVVTAQKLQSIKFFFESLA